MLTLVASAVCSQSIVANVAEGTHFNVVAEVSFSGWLGASGDISRWFRKKQEAIVDVTGHLNFCLFIATAARKF